ncbi:hypothetical protein CLIB1423_02S00782 [[Candida] railenensis]|uniref:DNA repair metallo-beta-lactamase domain-containing protein n=1 Tax=[Candida] railenensis TaxID=45579 RepID=A0A9P0QLH2_9ASCO|nr:hypothetical protein CLIB1423_02S00782 [[Candida] railenensis]
MKQQRSIFEFASQNSSRTQETIDLTVESDDDSLKPEEVEESQTFKKLKLDKGLTVNDNEFLEEPSEDLEVSEEPSIECPICSKILDAVDLDNRMDHVNACMGKEVKSEIVVKQEAKDVSKEIHLDFDDSVSCPVCQLRLDDFDVDERVQHVEDCLAKLNIEDDFSMKGEASIKEEADIKEVGALKRKVGNKLERPRNPYVNNSTFQKVTAENKIIKVPTTIRRRQSKRSAIPPVKTLTFKVSDNTKYDIAVDAFSFVPHEKITQYVLTHFHGDHYGGISKNWCYERVFEGETIDEDKYRPIIYCTEITGKLLTLRFSIDPRFLSILQFDKTYIIKDYSKDEQIPTELIEEDQVADLKPGLYITPITANHCPGAAIFLFRSISNMRENTYSLHCGDFRVNKEILKHPKLLPFLNTESTSLTLDNVYLDTTYMSPEYNFPKQEDVCDAVGKMFSHLTGREDPDKDGKSTSLFSTWFGNLSQSRITDYLSSTSRTKKKFLILVGTYLIGKENLAIAISKKLGGCPIYVSNIKSRGDKFQILKTYGNKFLDSVLTEEDSADSKMASSCMVHLVPMNIVGSVAEMSKYFNHNKYFEKFEKCIGLRPTGWTFSRRNTRGVEDLSFDELFQIMKDVPKFSYMQHILPQAPPIKNGNSKRLNDSLYRVYTLPYSEHSSFRELSYFSVMLRIGRIIPTVNIGNTQSIKKMDQIIGIWEQASDMKSEGKFPLNLDDF